MFKSLKASQWAAISILNLVIVASLGLLMRLKIVWELPWVDQRFTLHAHSHFAFSGWITQSLMLCIALAILAKKNSGILPVRYNYLLVGNLFCSYGILISFFLQGYAPVSIAFSTLTIFISIIFYIFCRKDMYAGDQHSVWWKYMHAAMLFNMLSALGTFSLAYTMATQPQNTELRLASIYFYLHFQYNGWFLLACLGLFHYWLSLNNLALKDSGNISRILIACCIPSYLLSVNWMHFPNYLHAVSISVALLQAGAWLILVNGILRIKGQLMAILPLKVLWLFSFVLLAGTIKFSLQTVSAHPDIATLACGLRPVVIAYLHLVLLGIISLFLIGWFYNQQVLTVRRTGKTGLIAFVAGVICNEIFLMIQGIGSMSGIYIGGMPELLVFASVVMVTGLLFLFCSVHFTVKV